MIASEPAGAADLNARTMLRGRVVDRVSGQPVAGATVTPLELIAPLVEPDRDAALRTAEDGSFSLESVGRFGVEVDHPDFVLYRSERMDPAKRSQDQVISLDGGETLTGMVTDPAGRPLPGVKLERGGRLAVTGDDGRFTLKGQSRPSVPSAEERRIWLSKEGYAALPFPLGDSSALAFTLPPLPEFRGRVDGPDGRPVPQYEIYCSAIRQENSPQEVTVPVEDPEGRFSIRARTLDEQDSYWLAIHAADLAPWSGLVKGEDFRRGDWQVRLLSGTTVKASVAMPPSADGSLSVEMRTAAVAEAPLARRESWSLSLPAGGPVMIPHAGPGRYVLSLRGAGVSPFATALTVGEKGDCDLGEIRLQGVGGIFGRASYGKVLKNHNGGWSHIKGEVHPVGYEALWGDREQVQSFSTDDDGNFHVEGVPVGLVKIGFSFGLIGDVGHGTYLMAEVREGEDTEIKF